MRLILVTLIVLLAVTISTPLASAQLLDGDVVVSVLDATAFTKGLVLYFNPSNPGTITTLAQNATPSSFSNWVTMAANNKDLIVGEANSSGNTSNMISLDTAGMATTLASNLPGGINGFELDGDNTWVAANMGPFLSSPSYLLGVDATSGQVNTFYTSPGSGSYNFNEMAILREGTYHYGVVTWTSLTTGPNIYGMDRSGIVKTVTTSGGLEKLSGIEVDPKTGDFITTDFVAPEVNRVNSVTGGTQQVTALLGANGSKINQDGTTYIIGFMGSASRVLKYDLDKNVTVSFYDFPSYALGTWSFSGVEVYGSRVITANGQGGPGKTIAINVSSQNAQASGAAYQLAASTGRRPGIKLSNGETLHLNVVDNIFLVSAQNLAPTIFQNFLGTLDAFGNIPAASPASIQLPNNFPANLGVTIFVSGVIYSGSTVVQVMNTHWFEL